MTWEDIAAVWEADCPEDGPRVAFRLAHNLSQEQVAEQWRRLSPGEPTMARGRIFELERWPRTGRRPSIANLLTLAQIYQCSGRRLLRDDEYARYSAAERAQIDTIDYRHLDSNDHRNRRAKAGVTGPPRSVDVGRDEHLPGSGRSEPVVRELEEVERRRLIQSMASLGIAFSPAAHALETVRNSVARALENDNPDDRLDEWDELVAEYGYYYLSSPPQYLLADLAAQIVALRFVMDEGCRSFGASRQWCRINGSLSILTAKTLGNLGRAQEARHWWNTAQNVIDASGDLELRLRVRGERIMHGLYEGRPPQILIRRAAEAAELARGHVGAGHAQICTGSAQALILLGRTEAAEAELRCAENVLEKLPSTVTEDLGSVWAWGEDRLRYAETWVCAYSGDEKKTDHAADRAILLYPPGDHRSPVQIRLLQALARVRSGDVTEGIRQASALYKSLSAEQRTMMIIGLTDRIDSSIPNEADNLTDVLEYRELIAST